MKITRRSTLRSTTNLAISEVAGSIFPASAILFQLDPIQYDAVRADWEAEQAVLVDDEGAAA